jgi:epoxide hydrolase-like predicted phosphatase
VSAPTAIISDFGGVLTSPLAGAFAGFARSSGVTAGEFGAALAALAQRDGAHPLFELETGRLDEPRFVASLSAQLSEQLDRAIVLDGFGEAFFAHLVPNEPMIEYMRALRGRGLRMALCTNNVREWEPLWRSMLPVDEIFEVVVDSAFVGARKPDPPIYELTLERLGVAAEAALLVDDIEINCQAARGLGLRAVVFRDAEQAIAEIEAALADAA